MHPKGAKFMSRFAPAVWHRLRTRPLHTKVRYHYRYDPKQSSARPKRPMFAKPARMAAGSRLSSGCGGRAGPVLGGFAPVRSELEPVVGGQAPRATSPPFPPARPSSITLPATAPRSPRTRSAARSSQAKIMAWSCRFLSTTPSRAACVRTSASSSKPPPSSPPMASAWSNSSSFCPP